LRKAKARVLNTAPQVEHGTALRYQTKAGRGSRGGMQLGGFIQQPQVRQVEMKAVRLVWGGGIICRHLVQPI